LNLCTFKPEPLENEEKINTYMSDAKEKLKALQLTIDKLEKTYGKGTVMKLSD